MDYVIHTRFSRIRTILALIRHCTARLKSHIGLVMLGILAIVLRTFYVSATPYDRRTYDTEAHLEYVRWILTHWSIPKAAEGYEFYHPPVYHTLAALWSLATGGWNGESLNTESLQVLSLLIACATVVVIILIAVHLFSTPETKCLRMPFAAVVFFLPGLVLFSSRLNNDSLAALFQFVAMLCLLRWWKYPEKQMRWYLCIVFLGLGILTKMNTIVLGPLPFLCLFFLRHSTPNKKYMMILGGILALLFLLCMPALRWILNGESPFRQMIPNVGVLGSLVLPPTELRHLIAFHPLRILEIPFNDNWDDNGNRMYVWDYLIRSALFGEWHHGPLLVFFAQIQLFLALLLLIPIAWGIRKRFGVALSQDAPVALIIPLFLIGEVLYRIHYPFSCSQDFRYVTFIALPMAYYLVRGIDSLPPVLRFRTMSLTWAFVGSAILFVLGLVTISG